MANCRLDQRQRPHVLCRIVEGWFSIRRRASESSAAFAGPAAIGPCSGEVPINPFHRISRDVDWLALYHAPSAASGWGFSFGGPGGVRHACGFKLANDGVDTRTIQAYLGHKSIQHTVRYTELAPTRFKSLFRD